jgi:integrase
MPKRKLTDAFIRGLGKPKKITIYYDSVSSGLMLRHSKAGSKTFKFRYRFAEKYRNYKIGKFPEIGLRNARKTVIDLKADIQDGKDPQQERNLRRKGSTTFRELTERFIKIHLPTLRETTAQTYKHRINKFLLPRFGDLPADKITRSLIIELLEDIALELDTPVQSNRVRSVLSSIFSFGLQRGIREFNPVKMTKPLGKEVKRDRVLSEAEIRQIWEGFHTLLEPTQSALKLLLLLGQRKGETCRMQWDHVDLKKQLWMIPAEHTKANRKHYVPLSPMAMDIISNLPSDGRYVFQSAVKENTHLTYVYPTYKRLIKDLGITDASVHDLRRTAATYMAEMGTDRTILGKVLNHKGLAGDSQVTARYDRYSYMKEKRRALTRWNQKLEQIITGTETKIHKIG